MLFSVRLVVICSHLLIVCSRLWSFAGNLWSFMLVCGRLWQLSVLVTTIFAHGWFPFIMKPTRVTSKTVYLINNILTNFIFDTSLKLKKGIIKRDVSDHFPVFASLYSLSKTHEKYQKITIHKKVMHDTNLMAFKTDLRSVD